MFTRNSLLMSPKSKQEGSPFQLINAVLSSSFLTPSLASSLRDPPAMFRGRIPILSTKPTKEIPANIPNGNASPLGLICVATEKRVPDINGPPARPAAARVWANPFKAPKTELLEAELVI